MPFRNLAPLLMILLLQTAVHAESADPRLAKYRTPPGWKVEIAATEPLVVNPVSMTWGPDGRLYVIEWKAGREPNDHIKVLTDADGDGRFDKAEIWMEGFDLPAGICFWDGWTYITLDHDVVRFHDPDMDGKYDKRESIVTGFGNDNSHHRVSGITLGPDGWLYLTTGDSDCHAKGSDGSEAHILRSGGVLRCKPDGSKIEVVAFGMRNPWGNVAFDDQLRMFHTDNDNEGAVGFTGCRLLHVVEGGDYGWRLREGARCCQPDYERATWDGGRPGRLGWITETGRGAPAGLCILNSAAFPSQFRNLVIYPDVFRKLVRAYTLKPKGASFAVDKEFELLASDEGLFRPDDAEVGPDGALYILDWRTDSGGAGALSGNGQTGRIYRMTWGGTKVLPAVPTLARERLQSLAKSSSKELAQTLDVPDYGLQLAAQRELIRRGRDANSALMAFLTSKKGGPTAKLLALAASPSAIVEDEIAESARRFGMVTSDLPRRRLAFEIISRFARRDDKQVAFEMSFEWKGDPPEVKRARLLALGAFGGLRRARLGENIDSEAIWKRFHEEYHFTLEHPGNSTDAEYQRARSLMKLTLNSVSVDTLAHEILDAMSGDAIDDPFLLNAAAVSLERLGPAGLDVLINSVELDNPRRSARSLSILQAWRGKEGLETILTLATGKQALPDGGRAGLFRALREMAPFVRPEPISAWLDGSPDSEPDARVEAIHVLNAMHERAVSSVGPVLPKLFDDPSMDVRHAAFDLARSVRTAEAERTLLTIAQDRKKRNEERTLAVAALHAYEDKQLLEPLAELSGSNSDVGLQGELLRALASLDFTTAVTKSQTLLDSKGQDLRREAIAVLGQKPEGALRVANLYNEGKLPVEDLAAVIEAVRSHATPELQEATRLLLKNKLLAAPTGEEAAKLREFVAKHGNAQRGREIFLDAKKGNCATCHRLEGSGGMVGPDLTRVWETLSFEKRVESILDPSKEIKEGFNTFRVATKDGKILSGLLLGDVAEGVTLRDAQGQEVRIPAAEIDEKGSDPTSLMPAGAVGHLSLEELADLLAFLGDRSVQEAMKRQE